MVNSAFHSLLPLSIYDFSALSLEIDLGPMVWHYFKLSIEHINLADYINVEKWRKTLNRMAKANISTKVIAWTIFQTIFIFFPTMNIQLLLLFTINMVALCQFIVQMVLILVSGFNGENSYTLFGKWSKWMELF